MKAVAAEVAAATAIEWAASEGWNPGVDDAERFLAADRDAFIGVELDGEVAGTVSCALYGPRYAFIGFYIVRHALRGRGIGTQLFDAALARAGDRAIGLDGVVAQQPVYASLGFELAHRNERWRGTGLSDTRANDLVDLAEVRFDELVEYDALIFGAARPAFLRAWIGREPGCALASVEHGRITGYAVLRRCRDGMKVGPLFADDGTRAERLLAGLRSAAGAETTVYLDVPHANAAALALAREHLDEPVFETARMYRNGRPLEDVARVFGVTTFELG